MTDEKALVTLNSSLQNLQDRSGQITTDDLEAEVINLACLEVLRLERAGNLSAGQKQRIADAFARAGQRITPHYSESFAANARLAVQQNTTWPGMWDFLKGYFKTKHGRDIDGASSQVVTFVSTRHERYEGGRFVTESKVDRRIEIQFTDDRERVLVAIEPTLTPKQAYLVSADGGEFCFRGADPDYRFTAYTGGGELFNGAKIQRFKLDLIPRQLQIRYF